MPLVQVRDLPEHIYRRLVEEAHKERRSLAQQTVAVLARGLQVDADAKSRRRALLHALRSAARPRRLLTDPARFIREDRRR